MNTDRVRFFRSVKSYELRRFSQLTSNSTARSFFLPDVYSHFNLFDFEKYEDC